MFSTKETADAVREARVKIAIRLPRSLADRLDREAAALANRFQPKTAVRDELIERALAERLPTRPCNPLHGPCDD